MAMCARAIICIADSLLALDASTGKLKWHFQFTPHDTHDWDSTSVPVLIDAPFRGSARKLVALANRNGFFYVLDRQTGEFLLGKAYGKQTWAKGLDDRGRPIVLPGTDPPPEGMRDVSGRSRLHQLDEPFVQSGRRGCCTCLPARKAPCSIAPPPDYQPGNYFSAGGRARNSQRGAVGFHQGAGSCDRRAAVGVSAAFSAVGRRAVHCGRPGVRRDYGRKHLRAGRFLRQTFVEFSVRRAGFGQPHEL